MEPRTTKKPSRKLVVFKRELPFYLMLIPGVTFLIIFSYLPMFGLVMAFQDFTPLRSFKNSPWVGLKNFRDMLALPTFWNVVGNTLSISIAKIILRLLVPLILALLLNEVVHHKFMRMAQTVFFLPYFLSWAVMGGVLRNLFQYDGMVNELLGRIGIDPIMFLGSNTWFPIIIILSDVWKDMGYNMIIFLAAITGVDPALNESAALDGANRWQQIWHITLPTIRPIVVMLLVLSLGSVLSAGMEQIIEPTRELAHTVRVHGQIRDCLLGRQGRPAFTLGGGSVFLLCVFQSHPPFQRPTRQRAHKCFRFGRP